MANQIFHRSSSGQTTNPLSQIYQLIEQLKNGVWLFGIPSWAFGICDRITAAFADGWVSAGEFLQFFTAFCFFVGWLCLKPESAFPTPATELDAEAMGMELEQYSQHLHRAAERMAELKLHHLIQQEYVLPFSHLCQIYHLLNLKHLESVHSFSLNNLRVVRVSDVQATEIGGTVKFQTVLDSPFNALRIWRQPVVEVDLTLLTPYTVELSIPVYNDKRMTVIFNAIPLGLSQHKLLIDIYSDLKWPKPILKAVLHVAACLTLVEDLPYLQKLAERNIHRVFSVSRASTHETMWLFRRFVALYGNSPALLQAAE